jgi:hypothetical protein
MSGVVGVCMVRDEVDIIGLSVAHHLGECDAVLVIDNGSRDGTSEVLEKLGSIRLVCIRDETPAFDEMGMQDRLQELAAVTFGADWVVPFDADEFWHARSGRPLREVLPELGVDGCTAVVYEHVAREGNAAAILDWRYACAWPWPKSCLRRGHRLSLSVGHHELQGPGKVDREALMVRHLPWRSLTQMRARVHRNSTQERAGAHAEMFRSVDSGYRDLDALPDDALEAVWLSMCAPEGLVHDPVPLRCPRPAWAP